MNKSPQIINIFADDSGVLHANSRERFFIYAGYIFVGDRDKNIAKAAYTRLANSIKRAESIQTELKAFDLSARHKRSLYNVVKNYDSFACAVEISRVHGPIMQHKLSIHRYKDYALKRALKKRLQQMIKEGKIDSTLDTELRICVDQQHTASDGYYKLSESIREELNHGIQNFNYGVFRRPVFTGQLKVTIQFCDSSRYSLIQASDILANRIFQAYNFGYYKLRNIPAHHTLELP